MMGTRSRLSGSESDAFSRRARRIIYWQRGEIGKIKRRFWKRTRSYWRSRRNNQASDI